MAGTSFAETLKDHNANVQKWRAVERDIRGKREGVSDTPTTVAQPVERKRARQTKGTAKAASPRRRTRLRLVQPKRIITVPDKAAETGKAKTQ